MHEFHLLCERKHVGTTGLQTSSVTSPPTALDGVLRTQACPNGVPSMRAERQGRAEPPCLHGVPGNQTATATRRPAPDDLLPFSFCGGRRIHQFGD